MEVTDEEAARIEKEEAAKKAGEPVPVPATEEKKAEEGEDEDEKDKGEAPNAGNGGKTEKYSWEQTLSEVTANVTIPAGTTGKMLNVVMTATKLTVGIKGKETIVEGEWYAPILKDDSLWCIETDAKGDRFL